MNYKIITVGELKEKYLQAAQKEYLKRLSRFGKTRVFEVKEERLPQNPSDKEIDQCLEKEGEKILKLAGQDYKVVLAIEGKEYSSEKFAKMIYNKAVQGLGSICFVIGSSYGIHPRVKAQSDALLSFSKMTLPHQLMQIVLLEQVYRAEKINAGEVYHK